MRSLLLLPLLLATGLTGCSAEATTQTPKPAPVVPQVPLAPGVRVEVAVVEPSQARLTLTLPGEVQGAREAMLSSPSGGFVEAVLVEEGERVKKGQTLAKIDVSMRSVAVDQAKAQLARAQDDLSRMQALGDLGTDSALSQSTTAVTLAEASLRQATIQLERAFVRAPFAGVIAARAIEEGEVANPGNPAFRLIQLDPAIVSLSVSDRDVVALKEGMEVSVIADARLEPVMGRLKRILPAGDMKTRTFLAEVEVPNKDRKLMSGMIATASISELVAEEAVVLPQDYLVTRLDGLGVYLDIDGVAVWRPVKVASVVRDQVVIAEGVVPGDRLVVTGHRELAAGDPLLLARQGRCCTAGRASF
jgi:RND family efflux transporter MFP subunit